MDNKPTPEQVAWIFEKIVKNAENGGTFRRMIYTEMGFTTAEYSLLFNSGGMTINNALHDEFHKDEQKV